MKRSPCTGKDFENKIAEKTAASAVASSASAPKAAAAQTPKPTPTPTRKRKAVQALEDSNFYLWPIALKLT